MATTGMDLAGLQSVAKTLKATSYDEPIIGGLPSP
jgi:hypothetical protein